jgi:hypothetical protein
MQMAAYGQASKGGGLGFSFAEYPQSLVVMGAQGRYIPPWTKRLEWFPENVKPADFAYFDFVLVNADPAQYDKLTARFGIVPVTTGGRWRLYRTVR